MAKHLFIVLPHSTMLDHARPIPNVKVGSPWQFIDVRCTPTIYPIHCAQGANLAVHPYAWITHERLAYPWPPMEPHGSP